MKHKLLRFWLLSLLVMLFGGGTALAAEETETITLSEQGYENAQQVTSTQGTVVTLTYDKGTASTAPAYYDTGTGVRVYAGGKMIVTASDKTITKVVVTFAKNNSPTISMDSNGTTTSAGDSSPATWEGSATEVYFNVTNKGHARIQVVEVTYESEGGDTRTATTIELAEGYATTGTVGEQIDLATAIVKAGDATLENAAITWESSDTDIATITGTKIDLLAAGTATIKATFAGDDNYKGSTANYTVTVSKAAAEIVDGYFDFDNGSDYGSGLAKSSVAVQTSTWTAGNVTMELAGRNCWNDFKAGNIYRGQIRLYAELGENPAGSLTLSVPEGKVITKIVFTGASLGKMGTETDTYSAETGTWEGSANSVTFTATDRTDIYTITVTYEDETPTPAGFRDFEINLMEHPELLTESNVYITVAEDGTIGTTDNAEEAAATIKGKVHGSYGSSNFTASVPVQGCVKITYATHDYGNDIIVTNANNEQVAKFNTTGPKWMSNHDNVVVAYYRTNEPTTLNFSKANYNPYFAVEAIDESDLPAEVTNYNISFAAGEGAGEAPKALEIEAGQKFNAPKNYTLYAEGKTLTGWNDGSKTYTVGEEITPEADMTLTAQYTANEVSLADRTDAVTINYVLGGYNDDPKYNFQGKTGIIVTQATVNSKTIDVKVDIDATSGKFAHNGSGWHQVNAGTKVTVPSCKDATISVSTYNDATSVNFNGAAGTAEGNTAQYIATANDATVEISQVSNNYWNALTITLPVVEGGDDPEPGEFTYRDFEIDPLGDLLTAEEKQQGTELNFGVIINEDGTQTRVAADNAAANVALSGIYHNDHGWRNFKAVVPVEGAVKITMSTCSWGSDVTVKNADNATVAEFTTQKGEGGSGCYGGGKGEDPNTISAEYKGEATTLTISGGGYVNYFAIEAIEGGDDPEPVSEDVTATWDFAGNCAGLAPKSEGGAYTAETMASNVEGIEMTIAYNGGSIKNNDNSYQVTTGVVMNIPVKSAGDLITVKGYPGYSKYTIGNNTEELTGDNEYKAKNSDAEAGYVAVTSKDGNNYYLSISVTQYAPQEPTTLVNEPATATFPFNEGTEGQKATFSNEDYFLTSKVSHGEGVVLEGKDNKNLGQTWFNPVAKDAAAAESNAIRFMIQPKPGFTFTPTKVSFKSTRFGTNGGKLDIAWQNVDKTTVTLATEITPNRDNATPNVSELSYDITGSTPGEGTCGLLINLYSLDAGKHVGFADIVIEGTLNGTEKDVPILASFTLNGTEYQVEDIFGDAYEATFELSKKDEMVGTENPLTNITTTSGELGTVTYNGDETHCVVTMPVTAGETTLDYVLNVVQKPDFTLTYFNTDGTEMGTQTVEKDATIGEFVVDYTTATAGDGYKVRGWFERATGGRKFTVEDVITANQKLYAVATEIEVPSDSKKYVFDLTDPLFYAEDHEAFNVIGSGHYYNNHGWVFGNGDQIELLVGKKANINFTLCQYSASNATIEGNGKSIPGVVSSDGGSGTLVYEGEEGTLTLTINASGAVYIHGITIFNTTTTNYDQQGDWLIVKKGDASSFLDAIEVAKGMDNAKVFLPDGTYDLGETVLTSVGGTNVSLIGQSTGKTIIKNTPPVSKEGLMSAATLVNGGTNFYMQDLTLQNALDYYAAGAAGRANAFHDTGNHTICKNVRLLSYQDTYLSPTDKQLYWEDSEIHGAVDYLCGGSDVYFNRVKLVNESRKKNEKNGEATITAHQPRTAEKFGYVFNECVVENNAASYNLGRAWGGASGATARPMAAYLNTTLNQPNELIATRFILKGMNSQAGLFHEYNSMDANGDVVSPASLVETFTNNSGADALTYDIILSSEEAANYALSNVFTDWEPNVIATQLEAPIAEYENGVITITPADNGAIAYLIEKNGEFVGITEEFTYTIDEIGNEDELTIRAANNRGGFGEPKVVSRTATSIKAVNAAMERGEQVIYNLAGQRVNKASKGLYIINGNKVVVK